MRELEVLKELKKEFKKNQRQFSKMANKEFAAKYSEYVQAIEMAVYCVANFPFFMPTEDLNKIREINLANNELNVQVSDTRDKIKII